VDGTRDLVDAFVQPVPITRPVPPSLGGAGSAPVLADEAAFADDGSGE